MRGRRQSRVFELEAEQAILPKNECACHNTATQQHSNTATQQHSNTATQQHDNHPSFDARAGPKVVALAVEVFSMFEEEVNEQEPHTEREHQKIQHPQKTKPTFQCVDPCGPLDERTSQLEIEREIGREINR